MMYRAEKINDTTYKITDSYDDAMYLLLGNHAALLIDTGMEKESLADFVASLTALPVTVALSHGHIDHTGQSGDFDNVYMNLDDKDIYSRHMKMNMGHFQSDGLNFKEPQCLKWMPQTFELGGRKMDVLTLGGHTPGSVIFVDQKQQMVFTGDAIGSGCGCWMQLDESLCIQQYNENIEKVILELQKLNINENWLFYGGHDGQEYQSKVSSYNRLDFDLFEDMGDLCRKLMANQIEYQETKALKMTHQPYYVCSGKAEMIVTKEKIR